MQSAGDDFHVRRAGSSPVRRQVHELPNLVGRVDPFPSQILHRHALNFAFPYDKACWVVGEQSHATSS